MKKKIKNGFLRDFNNSFGYLKWIVSSVNIKKIDLSIIVVITEDEWEESERDGCISL